MVSNGFQWLLIAFNGFQYECYRGYATEWQCCVRSLVSSKAVKQRSRSRVNGLPLQHQAFAAGFLKALWL